MGLDGAPGCMRLIGVVRDGDGSKELWLAVRRRVVARQRVPWRKRTDMVVQD
ncbi:secretion type II protein [Sesbania bispinosa]|nr:secretion type II protein [Sesbania bispinosa]